MYNSVHSSTDGNDDVSQLVELARNQQEWFSRSRFDEFAKELEYDPEDATEFITMDGVYIFYAKWHYEKFKKIPNRNSFTQDSKIVRAFKGRIRENGKRVYVLKCSKKFKVEFLKFAKDMHKWQKLVARSVASSKSQKLQSRNRRLQERVKKLQDSLGENSAK